MPDELITAKEAAARLGISPASLANARSSGSLGLNFIRIGGRVKYKAADVASYIREHTFSSTSRKSTQ